MAFDVLDKITMKSIIDNLKSIEHFVPVDNGGEGSGNFGHVGRPGEVGGSGEGGGSSTAKLSLGNRDVKQTYGVSESKIRQTASEHYKYMKEDLTDALKERGLDTSLADKFEIKEIGPVKELSGYGKTNDLRIPGTPSELSFDSVRRIGTSTPGYPNDLQYDSNLGVRFGLKQEKK